MLTSIYLSIDHHLQIVVFVLCVQPRKRVFLAATHIRSSDLSLGLAGSLSVPLKHNNINIICSNNNIHIFCMAARILSPLGLCWRREIKHIGWCLFYYQETRFTCLGLKQPLQDCQVQQNIKEIATITTKYFSPRRSSCKLKECPPTN